MKKLWIFLLIFPLNALAQTPPSLRPQLGTPPPPGPVLRAAPGNAPPPHLHTPPPKTNPPNSLAAEQARAKLREKIRAIRARKLAEVIQPDAATALKLGEIAERFEEQLEATRTQARTTRRDLVKLLQAPKPDENAVGKLTQQLISERAKLSDIENARETAVRAVLNPVQFARLVLVWPKINREIREEIYRVLLKKKARDEEI